MKKIKKNLVFLSFIMVFVLFFSSFVFSQQDYDIINLNAETYTYKPTPVTAGDEFELWIQLTNNSNKNAEDIEYFLDLEYPFSLIENTNRKNIEKIAPYQSKIIKYKLKTDVSALKKAYEIDFKYKRKYLETYNIKTYQIDVTGDKALVEVIDSNVSKTTIGSKSKIEVKLKNLGQKKAKDVFVTLSDSKNSEITVKNLKTQYIKDINILESKNLEFEILVSKDIESKGYTLPLEIKYSDSDGNYSLKREIGVEIEDNPEITINTTNINESFFTNQKENISIEIYNTGNIDAESVYVEFVSEITNSNPKYFIGNIEKDNYDSIDLEFLTKNLESGKYSGEIIVYYKNSDLKQERKSKEITLNLKNKGEAKNTAQGIITSIFWILGAIIGLALLVVILKWLIKVLIKPALRDIKSIFKKK